MKNILLFILLFSYLCSFSQTAAPEFDGQNWKAPYALSEKGWNLERFLIPIEFAPAIAYHGVEDLRFTKGWGDPKSEEYWSYAFLWYLDGSPETTASIIEHNLTLYYNGLVGRNIISRKIPDEKLVTTVVSITKVATAPGDVGTFSGTIRMLDYMTQTPMTLNCVIHHKTDQDHAKTFIFYEISPKPATDAVWKRFNKLWVDFKYTGKS